MLNELFLNRMKDYLKEEFDAFLESYNNTNIRALTVNNNVISNEMFDGSFIQLQDVKYSRFAAYTSEQVLVELYTIK